jgi:hypothetical protein
MLTSAEEQQVAQVESELSKEARLKFERDRRIKLGLVVVQLGGATFDEVFPDGLRNRPELTCIIGVPRRSWWTFLKSWFMRPVVTPLPAPPLNERAEPEQPAEPAVVTVPKSGLPTLNFSPLPDEVVNGLHRDVRKERAELLAAEEAIHDLLMRIEETRHQYLTPGASVCGRELELVGRCYAAANAADTKQKGSRPSRRILACGPLVNQLQRCAEREVEAFVGSE